MTDRRRTVYALTAGEYSDFSVLCTFDRREDAEAAMEAGLGDDIQEMVNFGAGEVPRKTVAGWWAHARTGNVWREEPRVWPDIAWDFGEVDPPPPQVYAGRPEVTEHAMQDGVIIHVKAATSEAALKACADRYAKHRAVEEGL